MRPLHLDEVRSSFFEDPGPLGPGTATVDSAFLMTGLDTYWRAQPALVASPEAGVMPYRLQSDRNGAGTAGTLEP